MIATVNVVGERVTLYFLVRLPSEGQRGESGDLTQASHGPTRLTTRDLTQYAPSTFNKLLASLSRLGTLTNNYHDNHYYDTECHSSSFSTRKMELLPITNSLNRSTESMIHSVASRSTESLKIDLRLQSDHSRESVLQDRTLEEQFESCVSLCKKEIEEALAAAKISTYAKTCFHPIARQIDDELIRLEIWSFDFGTKDGSWEEFSELVINNDAIGRRLRQVFENLNASLEKIGREMKLIQSFVEDAARSMQTS